MDKNKKEYIEREAAYDMQTLYDWYISSVSEKDKPAWTVEHLKELLNDFYIIPKDTPTTNVIPIVRCKDCKYSMPSFTDESIYLCSNKFHLERVKPDDYCSYWARKQNVKGE